MRWRAAPFCVAVVIAVPGCSSTSRSTEAFCETYLSENQRLTEKYGERFDDLEDVDPALGVLGALGSLFEGQGDFISLLEKLEAVAPDEILGDIATLQGFAEEQAEAMASGDLSRAVFGGLINGFQAAGPYSNLEDYTRQHCL